MDGGIHGLNGWDIYGSNGRSSNGKVSYFLGEIYSKNTGLQRSKLFGLENACVQHVVCTG